MPNILAALLVLSQARRIISPRFQSRLLTPLCGSTRASAYRGNGF